MDVSMSIPLLQLEDRNRIIEETSKPYPKALINELCIRVAMIQMVERGESSEYISEVVRKAAGA